MRVVQGPFSLSPRTLIAPWHAGHLRLLHESPTAYSSFMGDVATFTGVATMGMMMMAPFLFSRFGWAKVGPITASRPTSNNAYGGATSGFACVKATTLFFSGFPAVLVVGRLRSQRPVG